MKKCLHCGAEHDRRSDYCSTKCADIARDARKRKARKRDFADNVQHLPLMCFLLDVCKRQQSIAPALQTDLRALNELLNRCRYLSWASGTSLELSHYKSVKDGGTSDITNLGIWPRVLNRSFGSESLPIGRRFNPDYLKLTRYRCTDEADAFKKLSANKDFVTRFKELLAEDGLLAKPRRYDDWKRLQKAGYKGSLTKVRSLSKTDLISLLERHGLELKTHPEPDDQQRVELVNVLLLEHYKQCHQNPSYELMFADMGITPDVLSDETCSVFRVELLMAAITHDYETIEELMSEYTPNRPVNVIARRGDGYASEVHTWKGDDNKWHQTDIPTNPANLYTSFEKQFGEPFPF